MVHGALYNDFTSNNKLENNQFPVTFMQMVLHFEYKETQNKRNQ
jgi:hypothetical protein